MSALNIFAKGHGVNGLSGVIGAIISLLDKTGLIFCLVDLSAENPDNFTIQTS